MGNHYHSGKNDSQTKHIVDFESRFVWKKKFHQTLEWSEHILEVNESQKFTKLDSTHLLKRNHGRYSRKEIDEKSTTANIFGSDLFESKVDLICYDKIHYDAYTPY